MNNYRDFLYRHKNYLRYVLLLSLITFVILFAATTAHGAWYPDSSWKYRKQITIKGSEVTGGPHASFPVLIEWASDADLAADAQNDGDDILFTSSGGDTKIPHEIESFNGSTGALVAWVKVDLNSNPTNTIIYMYYGYGSATNQEDVTNVWNSNYEGVWHLEEDPSGTAPQMNDSTINNNDGTSQGFMQYEDQVPGKIGGSLEFDGGNDYVYTTDSFNNPQNYTVSAWFKTGSASGKKIVGFELNRTDTGSNSWDRSIYVGTDGKVYFGAFDGNTDVAISTSTRNDNTWHHAVGVRDDGANQIRLYIDGNFKDSAYNNYAENYTGWWRIGSYKNEGWTNGVNGYFPGFIDEVRISSTDRSGDWIKTEYYNQSNPSNFVIVGSEWGSGSGNIPPNVNAGTDKEITWPDNDVVLSDASGDDGGDGPDSASYTWIKDSGPGSVSFSPDNTSLNPTATFSSPGTYVLKLTVSDGLDSDEATLTVTVNGPPPPPVDDYSCSMKITILGSEVQGGPHGGFPVLISLTDESLKTSGCGFVTSDYGYDIIFTNSAKTLQLDHEIEKYDKDAGELIAWVKVDLNANPSNTEIYIYYGKAGAGDQQNPTGVWDSSYKGVWHLDDMNNLADSTSYNNNGTSSNVDDDTGKIGVGQDFDGNDSIVVPNSSSIDITGNQITLSAWVKSTADQDDDAGIIIKNNQTPVYNYNLHVQSSDQGNFRVTTSTGETYLTAGPTLNVGQWYFLYGIYNGSTAKLYLNGSEVGTANRTGNILSTTEPVLIGRRALNDARYFTGVIDEVHISNIARSTDWMKTEYNNQNDPSSFYSVEAPQCPSTTPPIAEFSCDIPITIDSSKVSGTSNLENFPVLISLTNTALKTTANCGYVQNSNGYDIIFSDATQTTVLDHEIEKYDGDSGELVAWVRVPVLDYDDDTVLYIHFGHSSVCGATENPTGVWDSNYVGVWHLRETPGTDSYAYDSTANDHDLTFGSEVTSGDQVSGKIGGAIDFDDAGSNDRLTMGDDPSFGNMGGLTVEAWLKFQAVPPPGGDHSSQSYFMSYKDHNSSPWFSWQFLAPTWDPGFYFEVNTNSGQGSVHTNTAASADIWYHVAGVYVSGQPLKLYVNGGNDSKWADTPSGSNILDTDSSYWMGGNVSGIIEEFRISSIGRSADWIQTEYNNQSNPSSFYSVGASSCFLGGFSCNRKITIDNTKVESTSDLTNFPVLIKIDDDCNIKTTTEGGSVVNIDGYDIIFTDSDGTTQLDHEIEYYNGTSGDLIAWVKVPTLYEGSDTDIYMYYGNSSISGSCDPSNPTGVWSSNYRGVWHLNDTSGATQDSTSYNTDGSLSGTVTRGATGQIDNAFDVGYQGEVNWGDPADGHLNFGTGEMTLSLWANIDRNRGQWEQLIMKGMGSNESGYQIEVQNDANILHFNINDGGTQWGTSATLSFEVDTWTYVVGVVDRNSNLLRTYKDGDPVESIDISSEGNIDDDNALTIGEGTWGWPDALIEEVRLSNTARSAGWIKTEFNNQSAPSSFYSMSGDTCGGEYGFDYQYCKKITVDSSQVPSDLDNFPLLINISGDDDLKTVGNGGRIKHSQGWDIVFRLDGCGTLDHEIEKYDGSADAGDLIAWVRVPTLSSSESSPTEIYMYYGAISNPICSPENPDGVWDANYKGVWHLDETVDDEATTGTHYDSTSNDNDGLQRNNDDDTDGKIGTAQMFDGNSDYISVADNASLDVTSGLTMEAWVRLSNAGTNQKIVGKVNSTYTSGYLIGAQSGLYPEIWNSQGTNHTFNTGSISSSQWAHLVTTWTTGGNMIGYINGSQVNSISAGSYNIGTNSDALIIGAAPWNPSTFEVNGRIDEVRISNTARIADWIATSYNNQNDPGNFYTISSCFEQTTKMTEGWEEDF